MSWNYRIVRDVHKVGDEEHEEYTIREVYYDHGQIVSWTAGGCHASGDTWMDCANDYAVMGRAFNLPIVDVSSGEPIEVGR